MFLNCATTPAKLIESFLSFLELNLQTVLETRDGSEHMLVEQFGESIG